MRTAWHPDDGPAAVPAPAPDDKMRQLIDRASAHLPPRAQGWIEWAFSRWPGRVLTASATTFARIEIFDRSMSIAAQVFTSIFPIMLMAATWFNLDSTAVGKAADLPAASQSVLDDALSGSSSSAAFGIGGTLIVLLSATSFSRALTRAYASIWQMPKPSFSIGSAWRWLAALLALVLSVVVTVTLARQLAQLPPRGLWGAAVSFAVDVAVTVYVPWILLERQIRRRHLLPGGLVIALILVLVRPAAAVWMPHALEVSAQRYGSIGVAFTYLAFLYVIAFCWMGGAVIGYVVTMDDGWFGRWIREGRASQEGPAQDGRDADDSGVRADPGRSPQTQ